MKTLYFDCFSGISGDMTIGALIDLGLDFEFLRDEIGKLQLDGFELRLSRVSRAGISAAKFDVVFENGAAGTGHTHDASAHGHSHEHGAGDAHGHAHSHDHAAENGHDHTHVHGPGGHFHRKASEIIGMIRDSRLGAGARRRAVEIFEKLAISEGRVHHLPPEDVEFHEVGALDSIVDVVGTAIGLDALGAERFVGSPINVGGGFIHCQHGVYPVPAPATANLLAHAPVYSKHVEAELVTPTGAAILAATIDRFAPLEDFEIDRIGYGAGTKDFDRFPNCLRLFLGEARGGEAAAGSDEVVVIEANIDDMSAEEIAWAAEKLLASGALDVVTIPVLMKKGRPGHLIQVLARPGEERSLSRTMFEETTTIGVRMRRADRRTLDRESVRVETASGPVGVKVSRFDGRIINVSPEYEDCARLARETGRPFRDIRADAVAGYLEQRSEKEDNG